MWILTWAMNVPLALAMRDTVARHLDGSVAADTAAGGMNYDWLQEFSDQASGVGVTLKPTVIGFAAVLDNLSAFIDNTRRPIVIAGAASAYLVLWVFLAGGIIDRYARDRPTRAHGFFAACGVCFFRFLRLGVVMLIVYGFLFGYMHPWLFENLYPRITHDVALERSAFLVRLVLYAVFGLVLAACNLIFDYAKVRAVVEDRRSMIGSVNAALRFVGGHYGAAVGLYLADVMLFVAVVAVYAAVAPGAGRAGLTTWLGIMVGQVYISARLWVKLVFWASETALFQSKLAHAGYVAKASPRWPESPMAEAIGYPVSGA